jgi:nicotinate-nucleotide adenylyltransferase
MNIAVLGGRFDPPHWGHFWVASQVLEKVDYISQVWLMPVNTHAWKKTEAEASERFNMVQFLTNDSIIASSVEIDRPGVSYTIDTIKHLKESYPQHKFSWIVGSDSIADFSKWRNAQKLALMVPFLVFPRSDYPIKIMPFGMTRVSGENIIHTNLSSTHIRDRIKKGFPISGFIPKEVEEYILSKNLYK